MKKILVVDDDKNLADLVADFCADAGYDVRIVTHSPDAVETAAQWQPDLISLDIEMPQMDGVEVLSRLKAHHETQNIPVLILSIVANRVQEEGRLLGARAVFQKPIRFSTFIERLKGLLPPAEPALH
jgi:two-component system alkaline phosphatase synthesis response regulator PhoP